MIKIIKIPKQDNQDRFWEIFLVFFVVFRKFCDVAQKFERNAAPVGQYAAAWRLELYRPVCMFVSVCVISHRSDQIRLKRPLSLYERLPSLGALSRFH